MKWKLFCQFQLRQESKNCFLFKNNVVISMRFSFFKKKSQGFNFTTLNGFIWFLFFQLFPGNRTDHYYLPPHKFIDFELLLYMLSAGLSSISLRPNSGLKQNPNDVREATTQQRELDMFPEAVVASDDVKPQLDVTKNTMVSHQYLIL